MKIIFKNNRGNSSVEFILVLPFVIFSITTFLFFSAICIKNINLHYIKYVAERSAFIFSELVPSCSYEDNPVPYPAQEACL